MSSKLNSTTGDSKASHADLLQVANIAEALIHPRDPNAPPPEPAFDDDAEAAASRFVDLPGPLVPPVQVGSLGQQLPENASCLAS